MFYWVNENNAWMNDDPEFIKLEQGEHLSHTTLGNDKINFFICWQQDVFPTIMSYTLDSDNELMKGFILYSQLDIKWCIIVEYLTTFSEEYKNFQKRITAVCDKYPIKLEGDSQ